MDKSYGSYLQRVKGKDTKPEQAVRKELWRRGYRYRKNYRQLPGKPDITFIGRRIAIFINGCFWHHHDCGRGFIPKSNTSFWKAKLSKNQARDIKNEQILKESGWTVIVAWECEIRKDLPKTIERIITEINLAS